MPPQTGMAIRTEGTNPALDRLSCHLITAPPSPTSSLSDACRDLPLTLILNEIMKHTSPYVHKPVGCRLNRHYNANVQLHVAGHREGWVPYRVRCRPCLQAGFAKLHHSEVPLYLKPAPPRSSYSYAPLFACLFPRLYKLAVFFKRCYGCRELQMCCCWYWTI